MWGYGGYMAMGLFMWLIPAAIVGLVIWLVVGGQRSNADPAIATLKRRLASGEIEEADYIRLRDLLK